jgi:hypothetical protein
LPSNHPPTLPSLAKPRRFVASKHPFRPTELFSFALAARTPATVRSRMISRANSANAPEDVQHETGTVALEKTVLRIVLKEQEKRKSRSFAKPLFTDSTPVRASSKIRTSTPLD